MRKEEVQLIKEILKELLDKTALMQMDQYIQHGDITTLTHCILVAYYSYALDLKLHLHSDAKSLITGALLHDYFLYDWHEKEEWHRWHGFKHAKFAYQNARRDYPINEREAEIIRKHMWPLNICPPTCREAWVVNFVDTFSGLMEVVIAFRLFQALRHRWIHRPLQLITGEPL